VCRQAVYALASKAGQYQECVSMMLSAFLSWLQEGCHSTSQQVHTGGRKKAGKQHRLFLSLSLPFFFFFLMNIQAFSKIPASSRFPFVFLEEWVIGPDSSFPCSIIKTHTPAMDMVDPDLGFGPTTCFGQWNVRGCVVSRSLKCAFTVELVLLSLHNSPWEEHTPGSL